MAEHEILARHLAYVNPTTTKKGTLVSICIPQDNQLHLYQLYDQINIKGVNAFCFTPLERELPVQLLFQGTQDLASVHRDLDSLGVGKSIFDREAAPRLKKIIERYHEEKQTPMAIHINGHSLGGADAQRATIYFNNLENRQMFTHIHTYAFCCPKIDRKSYQEWLENIHISPTTLPKIQLFFAYHQHDLIIKFGEHNLSGSEDCYIPTHYLIAQSVSNPLGLFSQYLQYHQEPFFLKGKLNPQFDFQYHQSIDPHQDHQLPSMIDNLFSKLKHFFASSTIKEKERQIKVTNYQEFISFFNQSPPFSLVLKLIHTIARFTIKPITHCITQFYY